jgi:activator of 2-hydroxyglutaryl-CoA dehydratase
MRLYHFLAAFRDALRFSHENLKPARCQEIERQALEAVSPVLKFYETKVKKAQEAGLVDETLAAGLLNMIVSIEFFAAIPRLWFEVKYARCHAGK